MKWFLGSLSVVALLLPVVTPTHLSADEPRPDGGPANRMATGPRADALSPAVWRREKRIIDLHQHVEATPERLDRAIGILDRAGVGIGVLLGVGTVTHKPGEPSAFERVRAVVEARYPGRFVPYMLLDYAGWDAPDWSERAAQQIVEGHRLGAAGLKEFKRLGLYLRDGAGKLIAIDDPKLDAVWRKCGELGLPVSIHVADPRAFWLPYDASNERWTELKDHRSWWFGDPARYPPRQALLEALDRVIERHPRTTFVCVHFANNAEDLAWVDQALTARPNMLADVAARIPEIGRHPPDAVRQLFIKHQNRILFATDFMVYDRLILGSGGDHERPTDDDAVTFYVKCWRWFETADRDWAHMTPIQGDWTISSIALPPEVCRKIYFDNARKLLARSLPLPTVRAARLEEDFAPDGELAEPAWKHAQPCRLEYQSLDSTARPELSTPVRLLWSDRYLYLGYEAPYTELSVFSPQQREERIGLWENDVVEAFIAPDAERPQAYTEYEWAPNGESLDLKLDLPRKDFAWSSGMESAVRVDESARTWRVEARIPWTAFTGECPKRGARWRINLFRFDKQQRAYLALSPTLTGTFHRPERFGWLEFE
ncbi:MAG: amidohydrolase family protein [Pirellulales bacterium]